MKDPVAVVSVMGEPLSGRCIVSRGDICRTFLWVMFCYLIDETHDIDEFLSERQ